MPPEFRLLFKAKNQPYTSVNASGSCTICSSSGGFLPVCLQTLSRVSLLEEPPLDLVLRVNSCFTKAIPCSNSVSAKPKGVLRSLHD